MSRYFSFPGNRGSGERGLFSSYPGRGTGLAALSVFVLVACLSYVGSSRAAEAVQSNPPPASVERAAEPERSPGTAPARKSVPVEGRVFEPPPVPEFMLKKPAKPLTIEEMKKQADEAADRARRAREANKARAAAPPAADKGTQGGPAAQPNM